MASRLILVTGGCRSGKSAFAQKMIEELECERYFLATCPVLDDEMADRVRRHRNDRRGAGWKTIEEESDPARALAAVPPGAAILLDCLTLWINNIMYHAARAGGDWPDEDRMAARARELAAAARSRDGVFVAVANEVGLGLVPAGAEARRFRDLAGRVNQTMAELSDEAYFLVCGLPQRIK